MNPWLIVPAALLGGAGSWLLYLASSQQQWLTRGPWPARGGIWRGAVCLAVSLLLFLPSLGRVEAVFTWLTLVMLVWSAAPFLGAWRAQGRSRPR